MDIFQIQRLSFDDQINNFQKTKEAITAKLGEAAASKHFNEAMHFIGIGNALTFAKVFYFTLTLIVLNVKDLNSPYTAFMQEVMTMSTISCNPS